MYNVVITLGTVKVFQSSPHCSTLSLFMCLAEASCQFNLDTDWPWCKSGVAGGFALWSISGFHSWHIAFPTANQDLQTKCLQTINFPRMVAHLVSMSLCNS